MKRKYEILLFRELELCNGAIDYLKNPDKNIVLDFFIPSISDLCGIMIKQLNHLPIMSFENEVLDNLIEAGTYENRVIYLTDLRNKFSFELSEYVEPYSKGDYPKSLLYNHLIYSNKLQTYILSVLEKFEKKYNSNNIKQKESKDNQPKSEIKPKLFIDYIENIDDSKKQLFVQLLKEKFAGIGKKPVAVLIYVLNKDGYIKLPNRGRKPIYNSIRKLFSTDIGTNSNIDSTILSIKKTANVPTGNHQNDIKESEIKIIKILKLINK